jgi:hypothetical protein
VAGRAAHRCEYCRAPEAIFNLPFEVEHIVPTGRGGADVESNWALSCRACNLHKSDHQQAGDAQTGVIVALFHPRLHRWEEHFSVEESTGSLLGLTPVGRATIARLQMNRDPQVTARRQWMRLKIYPNL